MVKVDTNLLEYVDLLQEIDHIQQLSDRAARLRELYFNSQPRLVVERVAIAMESWKETEGEPLDLRWAKLEEKVLEEVPITIFEGQKLIGNSTKYFRGVYPAPEYNGAYLAPLLEEEKGKITLGGPMEKGTVSQEDLDILLEAGKFWRGKTPAEKATAQVKEIMGNWYEELIQNGIQRYEAIPSAPAPDCWGRVVQEGLGSYIKGAQGYISRWIDNHEDDTAKLHFWQGTIIALEAVIQFAKRYAQHARELAATEKDPVWRAELEEIARICEWVPENPARTFREGLQSIMLVHVAMTIANPCIPPLLLGRPDRYLYPLFKRDLAEGKLTVEEAVDLMSDLLIYCGHIEWIVDLSWRDFIQRNFWTSIGLAGTDEEGNDASNELTYLILHTMGLVKMAGANVVVGWHKGIASWIMSKAIETNWRIGGGIPQFQNIDHCVDLMVSRGVDLKHARNWSSHGCSPINPSDSPTAMLPAFINIPLCIDLTLHNGVASLTGKHLGIETGDPRNFKTFDEFYQAFQSQTEHIIRKQIWELNLVDRVKSQYVREPLASALMPGCMDKGRDYLCGGLSHYRMHYIKDRGLIPTGDSLMAIKKLVYDEKKVTMDEILDALDNNFDSGDKKREEIRQMCLAAPKYGNDLDEVDRMVRDVGHFTASVIQSEKNIFGYNYAIDRNGQGWHFTAGKALAALPNGRKAREALADGSLSPMQGMDRNGPTAMLNSALKADFSESLAGVLNVKLSASLLQTKEVRAKAVKLTDAYLRQGGSHIQYNIVDAEVLREAKCHPEKYKDLVVRVGGFSAYFATLSPEIQDEIIRRTEHSVA